jgi:acetyl-CoA carboxylase biotin carboxyl carrier protein
MPPYVTVGAEIKADDTIGLMEIMKTFTAITSPVAGLVTAIHVKNEETLEPDQPLVSVKVS